MKKSRFVAFATAVALGLAAIGSAQYRPPVTIPPPLYGGIVKTSATVAVSQGQVQALGATEIDIVPAVTGDVLIPRLTIVSKASGAYTVAGVTALLVGWGTVADNSPACAWSGAPGSSILVAAGVQTDLGCQILSNGLSGGIPFGILSGVGTNVSRKLAIRTTGASPAGAGGALSVRIIYEQVPATSLVP